MMLAIVLLCYLALVSATFGAVLTRAYFFYVDDRGLSTRGQIAIGLFAVLFLVASVVMFRAAYIAT